MIRVVWPVFAMLAALAVAGCDKCGDLPKINIPGINSCSDTRPAKSEGISQIDFARTFAL